ncbi:MAG: hypothetical protein RH860_03490 [Cytophagales bacterium]
MFKCSILILTFFFQSTILLSQSDSTQIETENSGKKGRSELLINAISQLQSPQGTLSEKFKNFIGLGGGLMFKTRNDWYFGAEGVFMFNDNTKNANAVVSDILSSNGTIIGANGRTANIFISQRGMSLQFLKVGKLLWKKPVLNGNSSSGILGMLGAGILQHQYRIIDRNGNAPQVSPEYAKGYDELRNGLSINPFLAYVYFDQDKFINFMFGIEYTLAFTESRRDYDFLLMRKDDSKTTDHLVSLKLIWHIPIRKKLSRDYYYF